MNIAGTEFNLNHSALEIYISGCDGYCKDCHNPELWDFNFGKDWELYKNTLNYKLLKPIIKYIWVMGGEPLLQHHEVLCLFLDYLSQYKKPIMLWTRFYDIPNIVQRYIDYAKVGDHRREIESYQETLFDITLSSSNQKIIQC